MVYVGCKYANSEIYKRYVTCIYVQYFNPFSIFTVFSHMFDIRVLYTSIVTSCRCQKANTCSSLLCIKYFSLILLLLYVYPTKRCMYVYFRPLTFKFFDCICRAGISSSMVNICFFVRIYNSPPEKNIMTRFLYKKLIMILLLFFVCLFVCLFVKRVNLHE